LDKRAFVLQSGKGQARRTAEGALRRAKGFLGGDLPGGDRKLG